ncbi:MAG: radical SAM protein [Deltaproteobacteria bacterium]|jgi:wyosine [tRNA(Phe)-imidazoG37] synthetase (radical SAM superfamily)
MKVFGPVPSRRLGRSMGINNIPAKVCTYNCVYCQLGRTVRMKVERTPFYEPREIFAEARAKVEKARQIGLRIDYLTFVPDGEPTLDVNLGREIEMLRPLGIKVAVITNGSLISRKDVREELAQADWVSLKVDCVREEVWRRINRPQPALHLPAILQGMQDFAKFYKGELVTETILVRGINNNLGRLQAVARLIERLQPAKAYVSVPTRPPAEKWVETPDEKSVNEAYQIFSQHLKRVEYLIGYEGNDFALAGDPQENILSITAVHPMREEALRRVLAEADIDWSLVDGLVKEGKLVVLEYRGKVFYMRKLPGR